MSTFSYEVVEPPKSCLLQEAVKAALKTSGTIQVTLAEVNPEGERHEQPTEIVELYLRPSMKSMPRSIPGTTTDNRRLAIVLNLANDPEMSATAIISAKEQLPVTARDF